MKPIDFKITKANLLVQLEEGDEFYETLLREELFSLISNDVMAFTSRYGLDKNNSKQIMKLDGDLRLHYFENNTWTLCEKAIDWTKPITKRFFRVKCKCSSGYL